MDLNTTTSFLNNNQENNQLLLNAIKNKFDAHTAEGAASYSPPEFNIPILKIPKKSTLETISSNNKIVDTQTSQTSKSAIQLSHSLLKQLQERRDVHAKPTEFTWPQLQSATDHKVKFELPILKSQSDSTSVGSLTTAIEKLHVEESSSDAEVQLKQSKTAAIDLSSALANKLQTPTRDFIKLQENKDNLDFDIPFIDCDRLDVFTKDRIVLPTSNEYCVTDISQLVLHHSLTEPSAIGRFLCIDDNKYLGPLPLQFLSPEYRQQSVKYNIEPFRFETKSPDDLVLLALNKYQRRHCS